MVELLMKVNDRGELAARGMPAGLDGSSCGQARNTPEVGQ
jgi:hypothetical protein